MANTCSSESSSSQAIAVLVWSAVARTSHAHGAKQVVRVQAYDTLWSIAPRTTRGDVRDAIWRIQEGNDLHGTLVVRGARARPSVAAEPRTVAGRSRRRIERHGPRRRLPRHVRLAPTAQRAPSALLVRRGGERLLFDCGEGTQRQLMRSAVGLIELEEIFLTHFHADHYLGLPGMLKTFALRGRSCR